MGRVQLRLLQFAVHYPGWHSLAKGQRAEAKALASLRAYGLVQYVTYTNGASAQFRLALPAYRPAEPK